MSVAEIVEVLERNLGFIDYFHVTGGEPTLQSKPLEIMYRYVAENLELKNSIDTNGSNPHVLKRLAGYLDHVAIDIKAPLNLPSKYSKAVGLPFEAMAEIIAKIRNSIVFSCRKVRFLELRTTMVPGLLDIRDVVGIGEELKTLIKNAKARVVFVVQQFIPYEDISDIDFRLKPRTDPQVVRRAAEKVSEVLPIDVYYRTLEEGTKKLY